MTLLFTHLLSSRKEEIDKISLEKKKIREKNPSQQPTWRPYGHNCTQNWTISENYFFVMMEKWENVGF